jgi:hypothetical protein
MTRIFAFTLSFTAQSTVTFCLMWTTKSGALYLVGIVRRYFSAGHTSTKV